MGKTRSAIIEIEEDTNKQQQQQQHQRAAAGEGKGKGKGKALEEEEMENKITASGGAIEIEDKQQRAAAASEEKGKALAGEVGSSMGKVVVYLPAEIVEEEVLTRLPVKSLMRFKCVSKPWCSAISHPCFSKARRDTSAAASGLFIVTCPYNDNGGSPLRCSYATLPHSPPFVGGGEEESQLLLKQHHQFTALPLCKYKYKYSGATQVINGLFCLFADNHAWVCSITTREMRELPASRDFNLASGTPTACKYYFGYVPSCNEYKLLRLCWMRGHCEPGGMILTLGEEWRDYAGNTPHIYRAGDALYVDGTLYCLLGIDFCSSNLIAFSFEYETFQLIPSPPRRESTTVDQSTFVLCQFGGHFAVAQEKIKRSWLGGRNLELWILQQSGPSSYEWFYQVIDIPHDFPVGGFRFLGNLPPAGEMLVGGFRFLGNLPPAGEMLLSGFATDKSAMPVYSYNHTTGKFEKFVLQGKFPSSPCPSAPCPFAASVRMDSNTLLRVYYYEEDVTPLNDLIPVVEKKKKKGSRPATLNESIYDFFPLGISLSLLSEIANASFS